MGKETKKDKTTMTAREVAVLVEEFRSQFRTFGKDLLAVKKRVDDIFEEQGRQKEEIFIIKADINIIKNEVKEIKIRLDRVETRLDRVEEDIRLIKDDIRSIKENFKAFDKRISHLETVK